MHLSDRLQNIKLEKLAVKPVGRVKHVIGSRIEAVGIEAPLNSRCMIETHSENILADVVGFKDGTTLLNPLGQTTGIKPNSRVMLITENPTLPYSDEALGSVIDPLGQTLIGKRPTSTKNIRTNNSPLGISDRGTIDTIFHTGVNAIDNLFPIGIGQRMGLFAGTGVGKSMLLGMITRFSFADIVVVGLIGERGREVHDFVHNTLTEEARAKTVIVAAPADYPPILRMQGAEVATAVAEHYRNQGKNVLLLLDSVSRYAQAHREVALGSGEAPTTKGYPASVFAKLPFLIERAGKCINGGSITAIYTVLTEGDDLSDPVADSARGVLDGHIVLSRKIASKGVYPAVDVPNSISRLAQELLDKNTFEGILEIKEIFSQIDENEDLYNLGLIEAGTNKVLDKAMSLKSDLSKLVKQDFRTAGKPEDQKKLLNNLIRKIKTK